MAFITYLAGGCYSRVEILDKLQEMATKLNREDNLLIYYAGHGMNIS